MNTTSVPLAVLSRSGKSCPRLLERESDVVNQQYRKSISEGVWCYTVFLGPEEKNVFAQVF